MIPESPVADEPEFNKMKASSTSKLVVLMLVTVPCTTKLPPTVKS